MNNKQATKTHDLIGIGCGPSNLALAIALEAKEENRKKLDKLFIDKQSDYSWHGNTITNNSRLQISFLKDLVSLRDPTSRYTFINYLQKHDRLVDFINLGTFYPSRLEFNDYLRWVAKQLSHQCQYGEEVIAIEPINEQGQIKKFQVFSCNTQGKESIRITRSLVVGTGGSPFIPKTFRSLKHDKRVFHHAHYLNAMNSESLSKNKLHRIAIIGGGQSAAEAFLDINDHHPSAHIDLIVRASSLKPSDSSPFVNEIFSPESTDFMFEQSNQTRDDILKEYRHANYAAIDLPMIEQIYNILYQQKITGEPCHTLRNNSVIEKASAQERGIQLKTRNMSTGKIDDNTYDLVVLATGYERNKHQNLLSSIAEYTDNFKVDRNYRLICDNALQAPVYLQGYCEHSHGLSDTLLSVLAIRSEEIATSLYNALNEVDEIYKTAKRHKAMALETL